MTTWEQRMAARRITRDEAARPPVPSESICERCDEWRWSVLRWAAVIMCPWPCDCACHIDPETGEPHILMA